ncbi:hypothetical protein ACFWP2_16360 [Kitasatospora sp. NPDC058444]|uniref:hypothetical protein n=1 Tax=Kitasatospora sp. NPDC058444 TaxID=3346504 RepID=UPI003653B2F9
MLAVHLTLPTSAPDSSRELAAAEVQAALWGCAGPDDGLEHVRALAVPDGIGLVLYVRAPDEAAAQSRARDLLDRALAVTGRFPSGPG